MSEPLSDVLVPPCICLQPPGMEGLSSLAEFVAVAAGGLVLAAFLLVAVRVVLKAKEHQLSVSKFLLTTITNRKNNK